MLWSLWHTLWPPLLGGVLIWVGARMSRESRSRLLALVAAVLVGGAAVASYGASLAWPSWRLVSGVWFGPLGGEPTLACWAGLLLVGLIAGLPERRSSALAPVLGGVSLLALLVMNGPCSIFWHFHAASQANRPRDGLIHQSTSWTCTPSSSAMLLARWGIDASEGELAEEVGTSPMMGTDPIALAKVLRRRGEPRRLAVRVAKLDYAQARALGRPFVASIKLPSGLGHSVLVERMGPEQVTIADPLRGGRRSIARETWLSQWRDVCLWLEPRK